MTEAEAHNLILAYLQVTHGYGESVWGQFELWIGGSFALILTAHFAPERMNVVVTAFLAAIYVGFTWLFGVNIWSDLELSGGSIAAAREIADRYEINTPLLEAYNAANDAMEESGLGIAVLLFLPGLFIGSLAYLAHTSYKFHRK